MSKKSEELQAYLKEISLYDHVVELLYWDMETRVPKLGQAAHVEAMTKFSTDSFTMSTSEKMGALLDALAEPEEYEALDDMWKFIVTRMKRDYDKNKRIPVELYEAFTRERAESGNAWREAKNASDFAMFAPHLKKMIERTREITAYTDPGKEVYDALLDQYEEGMDSASIDKIGRAHV